MVYSIITPYRIADPMTCRILDWKIHNYSLELKQSKTHEALCFFAIQDSACHGIAPIQFAICHLYPLFNQLQWCCLIFFVSWFQQSNKKKLKGSESKSLKVEPQLSAIIILSLLQSCFESFSNCENNWSLY